MSLSTTFRKIVVIVAFAVPGAVAGHHTWVVEYDRDDVIVLEGIVAEVNLTSPHSRIFIEVEGSGGTEVWAGETWPLGALYRRGLTNASLAVGDAVRGDR